MRGAPPTIVELRAADGDSVSLAVKGFSADGALLATVSDATLLRAAERGYLHCTPDLLDAVAATPASARPTKRSTALVLLGGPGLAPPSNLGTAAAADWLRADDVRTDADHWFLGTWERDGQVHRAVWDYLHPSAGQAAADSLSAALQFVLDRQPGMPIDVIEANRLLMSLTVDAGRDPLGELAGVLEALGVRSDLLHEDGPLGFSMGGETVDWDCLAEIVDRTWLVVYAMLPIVIDGSRLADAPRLAGQINARLQIGCLLVEEESGTTMYRAAIDLSAPSGHTSSIRRLLDQVHRDVVACLQLLDDEPAVEAVR
ncbi:hypothetical protein SAMN04515671_2319 [Nakamurella panacisegetis]|uniref:Uncharacterized protein n=1 Tax=Nakamurella panacisegetis TaxID=1090615 RepID=A0A1H0NEE2_9ACTN|nr:hypothetical protein [Nakamurella panacisegetis]SDO90660.1 hypothetical protein SAMN04515671_2319 [Nakamurella panacisegetis]